MSQVIAGRHAVYHAIKAGKRRIFRLWIREGSDERGLTPLRALAAERGIPVEKVDAAFLARAVPLQVHQGVAAEVAELPSYSLRELLARFEPASGSPAPQSLLLLERIQDPQNLGALLRSALSFGVTGVVLTTHRSAPLSAVAVKAAAGAVEYLPLVQVASLAEPIARLQKHGFWVYGGLATGGENIFQLDFPSRVALVIGEEGGGLSRLVRQRCDQLVSIPTVGPIESLNASVAGGVLMAELARQKNLDFKAQSP